MNTKKNQLKLSIYFLICLKFVFDVFALFTPIPPTPKIKNGISDKNVPERHQDNDILSGFVKKEVKKALINSNFFSQKSPPFTILFPV